MFGFSHSRRLVAGLLLFVCFAGYAHGQTPKIDADIVYGHKDGLALTFDVIRPEKPNGAGVLFIQSGGWYSAWRDPKLLVPTAQPFLTKGVTAFIVRHGSAPKYTVPEAIEDIRRAVRVIRMRAKEWDVDPERLGMLGFSAGGHLTLMMATTGDDGNPAATDEVLKHGSKIAVAVAVFPPTDLRKWTTDPPPVIAKIPSLKPPLTFDAAKEAACSPLLLATEKTVPTLLIHGDKDELVPIEHSQKMLAALEKLKVPCKLVTVEGAAHGFSPQQNQQIVAPAIMSWFETYLAPRK